MDTKTRNAARAKAVRRRRRRRRGRILWCVLLALAAGALAGIERPTYRVAAAGPNAAHAPTDTPAPTDTATALPSPTPYPTYTPQATATERPTYTPAPTSTPLPTGPFSGTTPLAGTAPGRPPGGGPGFGLGFLGTIHWFDFLGSIGSGLVGWLFGGVGALIGAFADLIAGVVRVDQWPGIAGYFAFMVKVGGGLALGLVAVGAFLYYRSMLPGGNPKDGAFGLGMMNRLLESAVLLGGLGWGVGQLFGAAQNIVDATIASSGAAAAQALEALVQPFTSGALDVLSIVLAVPAFVVYLLIVVVKLCSVAALCWLVVIAALAVGTWPLGDAIAARWLASLTSVLAWGIGWGVWLLLSVTIMTDWTVNPLLLPFVGVALLLLGYGVPRMMDSLLGTSMAKAAGASAATDMAIGASVAAASGGIGTGLGAGAKKLLGALK